MILKKIIIFVTIFYSLNAEIIYEHTNKKFRGIRYDLDVKKFHKNVDLFLQDESYINWKDIANKLGKDLIKSSFQVNPEMECVQSHRHNVFTILKPGLMNLKRIALEISPITYDLAIMFFEKLDNKKQYSVTKKRDKFEVMIFLTQILIFYILDNPDDELVYVRTKLNLSCSPYPINLVANKDNDRYDSDETSLKSEFVEEDGATGGFDNKEMSDYEFQQRLESEENQKKKKSYQHKGQINEESEPEISESEKDNIYWRVSELNRDKEEKKLSKRKDSPMAKGVRAIGFMKQKDKGVKVKEDEEYAKALEKQEIEMLRSREERGERGRDREERGERGRDRERGEQKDSPEVNFYTKDIQKQIKTDEILALKIHEQENKGRGREKYSRKPENSLYESLESLNNKL